MAALPPRLLSRSIRSLCLQQPRVLHAAARRHASTKHPQGFVPPTQEDLTELRERVQEFTRRHLSRLLNLHI
jgi:isovaleryl-CoA dehydrogenase